MSYETTPADEAARLIRILEAEQARKSPKINKPRWRKPAQRRKGYWFVYEPRPGKSPRKQPLTAWGAPIEDVEKPGQVNRDLAQSAYLKYKADRLAGKDQEKQVICKTIQAAVIKAASPAVVTVADVIENYKKNQLPNLSVSGQKIARLALDHFAYGHKGGRGVKSYKGWGSLPADQVTYGVLKTWKAYHPQASVEGFGSNFIYLKAAFGLAAKKDDNGRKMIEANPLEGFTVVKPEARERETTPEDNKVLRAAIEKVCPAFLPLYSACYDLGCRPGELARLQARHYNPKTQEYELTAAEWKNGKKTKQGRYISLTPAWTAWTVARLSVMPEGGYIFTDAKGRGWTTDTWGEAFRTARESAGLASSPPSLSRRNLTGPTKKALGEIPEGFFYWNTSA